MGFFRAKLIMCFDERHHQLLDKFVKDINTNYLSLNIDFVRRHSIIDYRDSNFYFDFNKGFFKQQPTKKMIYLVLDFGETNNLNEWVECAFFLLQYEKYQELFCLQYENSILRICLNAQTNFDLFNIGLSSDNLKLLSKLKTELDIDFYHYLT